MYHKTLCVTFAVTPSVISRPLLIGEKILSDCLKTIKEAKIRWPIFEEQRDWAIKVQERYPLVVKHVNEGGVGAIEAVFRRLEVPLPYNQDRRRIRLSNIFSLYNF